MCNNCGQALGGDDAFCGLCGTPAQSAQASPGNGMPHEQPDAGRSPAGAGGPFFGHAAPRPPGPLSNTTRYLCAAAYLDDRFANRVLRELVATRRAVAPSVNLDIGPIIWHCRRARRNLLIRNIVLVAIFLLGLILSAPATVGVLFYTVLLGWLLPKVKWSRRGPAVKILFVLLVFGVLLLFVGALARALFSSFSSSLGQSGSFASSAQAAGGSGLQLVGTFFLLLILAWATEFAYLFVTYRTLIEELRLGAPAPPAATGPAGGRLAIVEGAQWGNIALYATEDPFIGAGFDQSDRTWSIAIRLSPADTLVEKVLNGRPATGEWVPIDPVELHQAIRERLSSLNDPALAANERVTSLSVSDRLVGSGRLRWDSPLVDASRLTPYSQASPEAVHAIIRHPQARLRYYQHVVVNDEGPQVTTGNQVVLDAADLGISLSAFVYTAVEGRHLYLEFILAVLPPIKAEYQVIDLLPGLSSGTMLRRIFGESIRRFFPAAAGSLSGIMWARRLRSYEKGIEQEALRAGKLAVGQLGADVSVRELGMADRLGTYIRVLDVQKYTRIIERALVEAVEDFLAGKGVDTSAFLDSATNVINTGSIVGSVSGSGHNIGGAHSTNTQRQGSGGRRQ